jgi:lipopolysaccharide transport system ATP-binding protein
MTCVLHIDNLSKEYRLGVHGHGMLFRDVQSWWAQLRGKEDPNSPIGSSPSDRQRSNGRIWALKDVSLEIKEGEVLGVIGRNGAGKSTLLKIVSRVTAPTRGEVRIRGRVASLLEVGTGFHPELTGRENIFLNGAILGMTVSEIKRKFDEIVYFSGVERFIDTPVKRYSSGMYVRLAFAVAAHLDSEILVVDEVLAVGDAEFQKKCQGKMQAVTKKGKTILFVSHNMAAVRSLCSRAVWLKDGGVHLQGDAVSVADAYLEDSVRAESLHDVDATIRSLPRDPDFRLESIQVSQRCKVANVVVNGEPVVIRVRYSVVHSTFGLRVYIDLLDENQSLLIRTFFDDDADAVETMEPGNYVSTAVIPANLLAPRSYELVVQATIHNERYCTGNGVSLALIVESSTGINRAYPNEPIRSKLQPKIYWQTEKIEDAHGHKATSHGDPVTFGN